MSWNSIYPHNSADNIVTHKFQFKIQSLGWLIFLVVLFVCLLGFVINAMWVGKKGSLGGGLSCRVTVGMRQGCRLHWRDRFMQMLVFWQLTTPDLLYTYREILLADISEHGKTMGFAFSWTGIYPNVPGTVVSTPFIDIRGQFVVTQKASAHHQSKYDETHFNLQMAF